MNRGNTRDFSVDFETDAIVDLAVLLSAPADTLSRELQRRDGVTSASAGANSGERTLVGQFAVHCAHAEAAVEHAIEAVRKTSRKHDLGALGLRSLSAGLHVIAPPRYTETHGDTHTAWPPQFQTRVGPPAAATLPLEIPRLLTGITRLIRDLREGGEPDHARTLEGYLRPGVPTPQALMLMRHELGQIRSIHMPVLHNDEARIDGLIALSNRALALMKARQRG